MPVKRIIAGVILFYSLSFNFSYASGWKALHEEAGRKTLAQVQGFLADTPGSLEGQYILGLVYLDLHKDADAKSVFSTIVAQHPDFPEAKWGSAEVLRRQHDLAASESLLLEVLKEKPDFSPAYISLAYIRYFQMRFEESVKLGMDVLRQGEKNVDIGNRVRAYLLVGGAKGMIAHYGGPLSKVINGTAVLSNLRNAQRLQPDDPAVMFGLGSYYLMAPGIVGGDIYKAREYLQKTIERDPLFADAYVRLGQLYGIKGEEGKYREYLNKALEIDPGNELANDIKSGGCKFICINKN